MLAVDSLSSTALHHVVGSEGFLLLDSVAFAALFRKNT